MTRVVALRTVLDDSDPSRFRGLQALSAVLVQRDAAFITSESCADALCRLVDKVREQAGRPGGVPALAASAAESDKLFALLQATATSTATVGSGTGSGVSGRKVPPLAHLWHASARRRQQMAARILYRHAMLVLFETGTLAAPVPTATARWFAAHGAPIDFAKEMPATTEGTTSTPSTTSTVTVSAHAGWEAVRRSLLTTEGAVAWVRTPLLNPITARHHRALNNAWRVNDSAPESIGSCVSEGDGNGLLWDAPPAADGCPSRAIEAAGEEELAAALALFVPAPSAAAIYTDDQGVENGKKVAAAATSQRGLAHLQEQLDEAEAGLNWVVATVPSGALQQLPTDAARDELRYRQLCLRAIAAVMRLVVLPSVTSAWPDLYNAYLPTSNAPPAAAAATSSSPGTDAAWGPSSVEKGCAEMELVLAAALSPQHVAAFAVPGASSAAVATSASGGTAQRSASTAPATATAATSVESPSVTAARNFRRLLGLCTAALDALSAGGSGGWGRRFLLLRHLGFVCKVFAAAWTPFSLLQRVGVAPVAPPLLIPAGSTAAPSAIPLSPRAHRTVSSQQRSAATTKSAQSSLQQQHLPQAPLLSGMRKVDLCTTGTITAWALLTGLADAPLDKALARLGGGVSGGESTDPHHQHQQQQQQQQRAAVLQRRLEQCFRWLEAAEDEAAETQQQQQLAAQQQQQQRHNAKESDDDGGRTTGNAAGGGRTSKSDPSGNKGGAAASTPSNAAKSGGGSKAGGAATTTTAGSAGTGGSANAAATVSGASVAGAAGITNLLGGGLGAVPPGMPAQLAALLAAAPALPPSFLQLVQWGPPSMQAHPLHSLLGPLGAPTATAMATGSGGGGGTDAAAMATTAAHRWLHGPHLQWLTAWSSSETIAKRLAASTSSSSSMQAGTGAGTTTTAPAARGGAAPGVNPNTNTAAAAGGVIEGDGGALAGLLALVALVAGPNALPPPAEATVRAYESRLERRRNDASVAYSTSLSMDISMGIRGDEESPAAAAAASENGAETGMVVGGGGGPWLWTASLLETRQPLPPRSRHTAAAALQSPEYDIPHASAYYVMTQLLARNVLLPNLVAYAALGHALLAHHDNGKSSKSDGDRRPPQTLAKLEQAMVQVMPATMRAYYARCGDEPTNDAAGGAGARSPRAAPAPAAAAGAATIPSGGQAAQRTASTSSKASAANPPLPANASPSAVPGSTSSSAMPAAVQLASQWLAFVSGDEHALASATDAGAQLLLESLAASYAGHTTTALGSTHHPAKSSSGSQGSALSIDMQTLLLSAPPAASFEDVVRRLWRFHILAHVILPDLFGQAVTDGYLVAAHP